LDAYGAEDRSRVADSVLDGMVLAHRLP